jgi:hypothetical protein
VLSTTRRFSALIRGATSVTLAAALALPGIAAADGGKHVALVVGVGEYAHLPAELHLEHARADAEAVAVALRDHAGFEVMELKDGFATRQALESFLVESLPNMVGPDDTLLIYIEAHGMGADFDDPYVLTYDAQPDDIQTTAMSIADLGHRVREAVDVKALVLLTDTAHAGDLGGLALLGPNAKSWPDLPENTVILSASSPREPSIEGLFAPIVVRAFQGEADRSGDGVLTASELHRFVIDQVPEASDDQVHPAEAGDYPAGLAICTVTPPAVVAQAPEPTPVAQPEVQPGPNQPIPPDDDQDGRQRRWAVAAPALGLSAIMAGGSVFAYSRGRPYQDVVFHKADVPDGEEYSTIYSRYQRWYTLNRSLGLAAGVLAVTGGFFAVVPVQDGATVGVAFDF